MAKKQVIQGELDLEPRTWGGRRNHAGRRREKSRHDPMHRTRAHHKARHPVHIVLRARVVVGRLRRQTIYDAIREALQRNAGRVAFRIVHLSIQHNHLHLLVEADDRLALSRGIQAFAISAAKQINKGLGRTGKVFEFRFHETTITSPAQARHALAYVLNNWRRHREHLTTPGAENALLDPYSSAIAFENWAGVGRFSTPPGYQPLPVATPKSWLLREGWKRHGDLDPLEVPGPFRAAVSPPHVT